MPGWEPQGLPSTRRNRRKSIGQRGVSHSLRLRGGAFPNPEEGASKDRTPQTLSKHNQVQHDIFIGLVYFRLRVEELSLQGSSRRDRHLCRKEARGGERIPLWEHRLEAGKGGSRVKGKND